MGSYRFYGTGSRIWADTDSTMGDPGFGLKQILQWWIQGLGSYRFYSGGSRVLADTGSIGVDQGFRLIQIL